MQNKLERFYRIGGLVIAINAPDFVEREELSPFRCEKEPADLVFNVETAAQITVPDESWVCVHKETYIHSYEKEGRRARLFLDEQTGQPMLLDVALDERNHRVTLREESLFLWGSNLAMKVMDLPNQVIWRDGIFLHTSFIQVRGEAILFAAQKQVGKSTQAELWRVHRGAEIVNGDRALLRKRDGRWCAWGSPYCFLLLLLFCCPRHPKTRFVLLRPERCWLVFWIAAVLLPGTGSRWSA